MVELREETGVQRSLTERLVRSTLQWAGHVERMADDRLPKRAAELREQGRTALNIKLLEPLAQGASRFEKLLAPRKIYWPPFSPDRRLYS